MRKPGCHPRRNVQLLQANVWNFVAAAIASQFRQFETSAPCLNISFAFIRGADFQVVGRSVRWNQVCERGLHVRLMVRRRCGRGMREASESPSRSAVREIISEERCDDPVESGPKQRIYEECGQRPKVPPPLRLPAAAIGAVILHRWVLWCAPMRHFIRRRAGPPKNAGLCMPRTTHKFAVLFHKESIRTVVCCAAILRSYARVSSVQLRSLSVTAAIYMPRRRSIDTALMQTKARLSGVGDTESLPKVGFATSMSERRHPHWQQKAQRFASAMP
ncbi:hypothetical protein GGD67_003024 [Bradyrhizobium sp. IAR9]|nr:hypothetical protein [Bradyrhizobium sp. IAR9]